MKTLNQINARAMRIFLAILKEGSLSEVARQEGIAPSSVSRTLVLLEHALETPLLYRNTRAVIATEAGLVYADAFRQMLQQLDRAQAQVDERRREPGGHFRLNAPLSFGLRHVAPWLRELSERYPAMQVEVNLTDDYIDPLSDATDLIFRISPMTDSALHGRYITHQHAHLVASPDYLARYGFPKTPDDLSQHALLVYRGKLGAQRWSFSRGNENVVVSPQARIVSDNAEVLVRAALDGAGILLFPDWQVGRLLKAQHLTELMTDYVASTGAANQALYMLYPGTHFPSLNTRTVIDFFIEKFGTPPYWKYQEPQAESIK